MLLVWGKMISEKILLEGNCGNDNSLLLEEMSGLFNKSHVSLARYAGFQVWHQAFCFCLRVWGFVFILKFLLSRYHVTEWKHWNVGSYLFYCNNIFNNILSSFNFIQDWLLIASASGWGLSPWQGWCLKMLQQQLHECIKRYPYFKLLFN